MGRLTKVWSFTVGFGSAGVCGSSTVGALWRLSELISSYDDIHIWTRLFGTLWMSEETRVSFIGDSPACLFWAPFRIRRLVNLLSSSAAAVQLSEPVACALWCSASSLSVHSPAPGLSDHLATFLLSLFNAVLKVMKLQEGVSEIKWKTGE